MTSRLCRHIMSISLCFLICLSSCSRVEINSLSDELIPITLKTNLFYFQTKAHNTSFDENDSIGLYVLTQPNQIGQGRHVDNMCFKYTNSSFTPKQKIYYPKEGQTCNFLGYYPYQPSALSEGSSNLRVEIKSDQSKPENSLVSDFLEAKTFDISPGKEAVLLEFSHRCTKINLEIKPGGDFPTVESLIAAKPALRIKGLKTVSVYDMNTSSFASLSEQSDIIPFGSLEIKENVVSGLTAIILPQNIDDKTILVDVAIGERHFYYTMNGSHIFASGTQETFTLSLSSSPTSPDIPGTISTTISDWGTPILNTGELIESVNSTINQIPDFSLSGIYKVFSSGIQVAEVCKEYLRSDNIDSQAIVIYPVANGVTDLTNGFVAQVIGSSEKVHGGKASWDIITNKLTYTPGTSDIVTNLHVDSSGNISATTLNDISITTEPDILNDSRDSRKYKMVKIGTQYWMGENLKATALNDRTAIPVSTIFSEAIGAAYCTNVTYTSAIYGNYYNYASVATTKLAPQGWSVPTKIEWENLKTYIGTNNASVLKGGSLWAVSFPLTVTNLTGFNAEAIGIYGNGGNYISPNEKTFFWCCDGGFYVAKIAYNSADLVIAVDYKDMGRSVRCIRK